MNSHQNQINQSLSPENLNRFIQSHKASCDWMAIKKVTELSKERYVENQKLKFHKSFLDQGYFLEVLINGHFGYASASVSSIPELEQLFKRAQMLAEVSSAQKIFNFTEKVRPAQKGRYDSPRKMALDQLSEEELMSRLIKIDQSMQISDKIISTNSYLRTTETEQNYLSSSGAEWTQQFTMLTTNYAASASNGSETQQRSDFGSPSRCYQGGLEFFNFEETILRTEQVAREAVELLTADDCPTETCDVILAPDQMMLQIHESIGHPLELDRILGDERNFAGSSFLKLEDFGNLQYGSDLMNVIFEPDKQNALASYKYDELGNPAQKVFLIEKGILKNPLGSLESQSRAHEILKTPIGGVANSRASSWNRAPIDRMANINLIPGTQTIDQLVGQVERGLLMRSNRSWSIDDYRDKFQFGCEYGQLIEDGKITKTLKNPNYRGQTVPFWKSLSGLAAGDDTFGTPYCGKGEPSQIIRVGHSSPYALFKNIEVFGGGIS